MASRKSTAAELSLVQLRNCFVNLPVSLSNILLDANAIVQNVIIELQYQTDPRSATHNTKSQPSVFLGWTGMTSQRRTSTGAHSLPVVEIDAAFARTLGLIDRQKVQILLHLNPPIVHTLHVEPLTAADWEIIELHATFLETNLLAQIRAVPNPVVSTKVHPLTVHLSPTSTANILVTSLEPVSPPEVPFVKISPDAEIIVAPKTRMATSKVGRADATSIASGGRRSTAGRSGIASTRHKIKAVSSRGLFLRTVILSDLYPSKLSADIPPVALGVDEAVLSRLPKGTRFVSVMVVRPGGSQQTSNTKEAIFQQASKVVAIAEIWDDAPDEIHALMSSSLVTALDGMIETGNIIRIQPASEPIPAKVVSTLKVSPFPSPGSAKNTGIKFGGETRASRQAAAEHIKSMYKANIFDGPITEGMLLPHIYSSEEIGWYGGIVRFEYSSTLPEDEKFTRWIDATNENLEIQVQQEINRLSDNDRPNWSLQMRLVGKDSTISDIVKHLRHGSSILLCGGIGSGKSSIASQVAQILRGQYFYTISYQSCRKLLADDIRLTTIKDTLEKAFSHASWGTTLGGKALVILDDLDRLCSAEQELQVGNDNARARQISEILSSLVHRIGGPGSRISVLITAQSKGSLHNIIVGGHVFRETIELKAPNKDSRRRILESLVSEAQESQNMRAKETIASGTGNSSGWLENSDEEEHTSEFERSSAQVRPVEPVSKIDYLDFSNSTDGYMPGDLKLLISRAQSYAMTRLINHTTILSITLSQEDFTKAIEGFTPASLRNVTLQTSSTKFDSVGGLKEARKILVETLQYPTAYAPIFDRCPLRLRSGLLLYGYPGCGKTLLASAVAGECGLNFISVKGPEILNKYIGASEKSIRDLFDRAEAAKPCILFFDEFDSIAPKRGHDSTGVTDRVVNQLLTQMDGAEGLSGVYVLAATSRPDLIDPALLRPGRLDKSLICDMPSEEDRLDILRAVAKDLYVHNSILRGSKAEHSLAEHSLAEVARRTEGYTGADLQAIMYNSHLEAIHDTLNERKDSPTVPKPTRTGSKSLKNNTPQKEYLHLKFGAEAVNASSNDTKSRAHLAILKERLEAAKLGRRKERERRHQEYAPGNVEAKGQKPEIEVMIHWKHIEASLLSTRSSMSKDERIKLEHIYKEFLSARDGEMPSGQGPTEVGARSSLM